MAGLETDTITLGSLARTPASSRSGLYEGLPLPQSKSSIRLLHLDQNVQASPVSLEGKLRVVELDDSPEFAALSYVWKDSAQDKWGDRCIRCNNFELPITKSCHDALTSLRDSCAPMDIWVDSICINQDNEEEKNLQIEIMTDIYTWAKTVYVWLGPGSINTDKAMKCLKRASNFRIHYPGIPWDNKRGQNRNRDICSLVTSSMLCFSLSFLSALPFGTFGLGKSFKAEDLDELLSKDWIGRAWTYQEIIFASNPIIDKDVWALPIFVGGFILFINVFTITNIIGVTPYVWGDKDGESRLFTGIVQALRERQATRVADKAFALHEVLRSIGISRAPQPELQQNVSEVYHGLFVDLLNRKTSLINLLIDVGGLGNFPDVPSWVPDWRSSHKNDWGQSEFISHHTELYGAHFPEPQMVISRDKLGLWACRKGTVREPLPGMATGINVSGSDGDVEDFRRLANVFIQCLSRAFEQASASVTNTVSDRMDLIHEGIYKALAGTTLTLQEGQDHDMQTFQRWINLSRERSDTPTSSIPALSHDDQLRSFMKRCYRYVEGRDMFITTDGIYGTGPPGMAAGDEVMWLRGVAVPMILRPVEEEGSEFKVIGPAVVPGLMDLSAFNGAVHGDGWEIVYLT